MQFTSKEFYEALAEKMKTDEQYKSMAQGLTLRLCYLIKDCPGDIDRFVDWRIEEGQPISFNVEEQSVPSDFREQDFDPRTYFMRVSGDYQTFVKLNTNEMSPIEAISSRAYKIDGPMTQIMGMMGTFTIWTNLMSTIPCEY